MIAPGVVVERVSDGTSADLGGIQAGDRMMTWNGESVESIRDWMELLANHEPGDVVTVGVDRNGERVELDVTLQASDR